MMVGKKSTRTKTSSSKSNAAPFDQNLINMNSEDIKAGLVELIKEKSLFNRDSVLPSGKITTNFVDLKETTLSARGAFLASMAILHNLKDEVRAIGGLHNKVYSLAASTAQLAYIRGQELDTFLVRLDNEARSHGYSKWIEGPLKPGTKVCIVHDEVVDGMDVVEVIRKLQDEADSQIVQMIAIFDRLDGAKLRLEEYGVDYTAIVTMDDIVQPAMA